MLAQLAQRSSFAYAVPCSGVQELHASLNSPQRLPRSVHVEMGGQYFQKYDMGDRVIALATLEFHRVAAHSLPITAKRASLLLKGAHIILCPDSEVPAMDYATLGSCTGLGVALLISEMLPFIKSSKAKGVLQAILMLLQGFSQGVSSPCPTQATAGTTTS